MVDTLPTYIIHTKPLLSLTSFPYPSSLSLCLGQAGAIRNLYEDTNRDKYVLKKKKRKNKNKNKNRQKEGEKKAILLCNVVLCCAILC